MKSSACSYSADSNFDVVHAVKVMSRPYMTYRSVDMTMYVSPRQDDKQDLKVLTTVVISTHNEITITTRSTYEAQPRTIVLSMAITLQLSRTSPSMDNK